MGDIGIGEISRLFKVLSVNNRQESVSYRVLGIGICMIYSIGIGMEQSPIIGIGLE